MRVLVVDDEPSILRSTLLLLEDMGHSAMGVSNVNEVVPTIRTFEPEVLLQDIRMPGLDISSLVRSVRAEGRQVRVVLWSASTDAAEIAQKLGVTLLEKPFKPSDLASHLEAPEPVEVPSLVAEPKLPRPTVVR